MKCTNPYFKNGVQVGRDGRGYAIGSERRIPFPCGKCLNCRINRYRLWRTRIILEAMSNKENLYVTLTYNGFAIPYDKGLSKRHVTLFLKKLRKSILPKKLRYFVCGEYGGKQGRPHYHLAIFGIGFGEAENIGKAWRDSARLYGERIEWDKGFIQIGFLTDKSAGYISGYVCKGLYQNNEHVRRKLNGRKPEFQMVSRKPGLGAFKARDIAYKLGNRGVDVQTINIGRRSYPIGRYLREIIASERQVKGEEFKSINEYYDSVYDGRDVEEIMQDAIQIERQNLAKLKIHNKRKDIR